MGRCCCDGRVCGFCTLGIRGVADGRCREPVSEKGPGRGPLTRTHTARRITAHRLRAALTGSARSSRDRSDRWAHGCGRESLVQFASQSRHVGGAAEPCSGRRRMRWTKTEDLAEATHLSAPKRGIRPRALSGPTHSHGFVK